MSRKPWPWFLVMIGVLIIGLAAAETKKEPEKKKGTVIGTVTAKSDSWLHVKADGEERARKYLSHWRGGSPKDGGAYDKEMLKTIKELKVGDRVRLEWEFEERTRVVKVEVLKPAKESKEK